MSTKVEELSEKVAAAKRKVAVAEALQSEQRRKLVMAEEEVGLANNTLSDARVELEEALVEEYQAVHGKPVSFDDRMAFEQRWDARVKEQQELIQAHRARREARMTLCDELERKKN